MSGDAIALEVNAALAEVARDVGDGEFLAYLIRPAAQPDNPWDTPEDDSTTYNLNVLDMGMRLRHDAATLIQRRAHIIMVPAVGLIPLTSDRINLRDREYAILAVETVAPGGVDLYYEIEIDGGTDIAT